MSPMVAHVGATPIHHDKHDLSASMWITMGVVLAIIVAAGLSLMFYSHAPDYSQVPSSVLAQTEVECGLGSINRAQDWAAYPIGENGVDSYTTYEFVGTDGETILTTMVVNPTFPGGWVVKVVCAA